MGDRDISWCFHYLTQELRRHPKICGYIYTELQDIEWEHNGFMNYDRTRKMFGYKDLFPMPDGHPPLSYRDLNTQDFLILDAPAGEDLSEQSEKSLPVALSLYSGRKSGRYQLGWQLYESTRLAPGWHFTQNGEGSIQAEAYTVTQDDPIVFSVPPQRLLLLYAWVKDSGGQFIARNWWTFHSFKEPPPSMDKRTQWRQRWNPKDYTEIKGTLEKPKSKNSEIISLSGEASVTYEVQLPVELYVSSIKDMVFECELSGCSGIERVEWKDKIRAPSTPQTDVEHRFPTTVQVYANDEFLREVTFVTDPADYNGILSNIFDSAPPSSYGYLQEFEIPVSILKDGWPIKIEIKTKEGTKGGLRIFGARSGRYPVAPSIKYTLKRDEE